jgi:tryptophan synthase alpha chain
MGRIAHQLESVAEAGGKALAVFVTGGDPTLGDLPAILDALADGGADVIEVGVPFSDPIADGPTIQASSHRALELGAGLGGILGAVAGFRRVPVLLMGYLNPMLAYGLERLAADAAAADVAGTLVCDALPEGAERWRELSAEHGLENVFLAAPTCTEERLARVCAAATGFVYAVSRTGVTGAGDRMGPDAAGLVGRLRRHTAGKVLVGFGVSTPAHVAEVCGYADGAVVGSPVVELLHREWRGGAGRAALVDFVRSLKEAAR